MIPDFDWHLPSKGPSVRWAFLLELRIGFGFLGQSGFFDIHPLCWDGWATLTTMEHGSRFLSVCIGPVSFGLTACPDWNPAASKGNT